MTKAELKQEYMKARGAYVSGRLFTNEYALQLDTMLSAYFSLPLASPPDEDPDLG